MPMLGRLHAEGLQFGLHSRRSIMASMIDKSAVPTKLLWVDLEMTGLDPQKDVILEIAAEITDFNSESTTFPPRWKETRSMRLLVL